MTCLWEWSLVHRATENEKLHAQEENLLHCPQCHDTSGTFMWLPFKLNNDLSCPDNKKNDRHLQTVCMFCAITIFLVKFPRIMIMIMIMIIIIIIIIMLLKSQIILAEHECSTNWGDCKSNRSNQINQIKCWFLRRGENQSTQGKTSRSRVENQQTQPTYDAKSGDWTRDTLVEGERSHHCANNAPHRKFAYGFWTGHISRKYTTFSEILPQLEPVANFIWIWSISRSFLYERKLRS